MNVKDIPITGLLLQLHPDALDIPVVPVAPPVLPPVISMPPIVAADPPKPATVTTVAAPPVIAPDDFIKETPFKPYEAELNALFGE